MTLAGFLLHGEPKHLMVLIYVHLVGARRPAGHLPVEMVQRVHEDNLHGRPAGQPLRPAPNGRYLKSLPLKSSAPPESSRKLSGRNSSAFSHKEGSLAIARPEIEGHPGAIGD